MPDPKNYNFDYRPKSYWGPQEVKRYIGARVKGELRRLQAISDLKENHADPEIISEKLTEENRAAAGAVHPWLMGGEYLPDLKPNEVEIARVVMQSTTMDVISIRARRTKRRILYRIVDEYDDEFIGEYHLNRKSSLRPLTFGELIKLMDDGIDGGLVGHGRDLFYGEGTPANEIYDFETASSAYYRELSEWYGAVNEEWLHEKQSEESQAELEGEYDERYFEGDPPESPEEEIWRDTHRKDLERRKSISDCLSKSEWERVTGSYLSGFANSARYKKIKSFIETYLQSNNSLPVGIHSVDGFKVDFKE